jgi:hypothetical protein
VSHRHRLAALALAGAAAVEVTTTGIGRVVELRTAALPELHDARAA